jgi:hypothetical protein
MLKKREVLKARKAQVIEEKMAKKEAKRVEYGLSGGGKGRGAKGYGKGGKGKGEGKGGGKGGGKGRGKGGSGYKGANPGQWNPQPSTHASGSNSSSWYDDYNGYGEQGAYWGEEY